MREYHALLSRPESLARVQSAHRAIERAGGFIEIRNTTTAGLMLVVLRLPPGRTPDQFIAGLPFYLEGG
jgi:hypothetical protein